MRPTFHFAGPPVATALRDAMGRIRHAVGGAIGRVIRTATARVRLPGVLPALKWVYSRLPNRHSLTTKIIVVAIVFSIVPVIIYQRLGEAEREKWGLFVNGARERGTLIAAYLTPLQPL